MVKIKVSNFSVEKNQAPSSLPELEINGFILKTCKNDETFSEKSIKNDYTIIMSESEYREKMASRSGKKSNPLMVNFEEYE